MKKKIMIGVSYAAVAALAVGGTMAYFTSTKDAVNVMTFGEGISIELIEQQRSEDGSELVDFKQGKELLPIVGSAQGDKDQWGMPVAKNYVDKIVTVENTGNEAAYVRVIVGVPAALESTKGSDGPLHWNLGNNFTADGDFDGTENPASDDIKMTYIENQTIDGIAYNVYTFTYNTALAAGETTEAAPFTGFYLNSAVDYDADKECYTFNGEEIDYDLSDVIIPVQAQAILAEDWETAAEGFAAAEANNQLPANPWTDADFATDAEAMAESLAAGSDVTLAGKSMILDEDIAITLNSNVTADRSDASGAETYSALTVAANVTMDGTGSVENEGGYAITVKGDEASLTINGGNYKGNTTVVNVVKGSLTINGGFFEAVDAGYGTTYLINCIDANYKAGTASVSITGGTFVNWNPADNAAEGAGTDFVAAGCTVVEKPQENGDIWYTVVAE
ncbi:MAG: hypothetical protein IJ512_03390 [Ruminococcus sp.]|nr:hypothetical protein [Ruminococcus sp.]